MMTPEAIKIGGGSAGPAFPDHLSASQTGLSFDLTPGPHDASRRNTHS